MKKSGGPLMVGEWPVPLKVMGKESPGGRFLGLQDIIDLFKNRSFPERMKKRLGRTVGAGALRRSTQGAIRKDGHPANGGPPLADLLASAPFCANARKALALARGLDDLAADLPGGAS